MDDKYLTDVYAFQRAIYDSLNTATDRPKETILNLKQVFEFIANNFDKLTSNVVNLTNILPILQRTIQLEMEAGKTDTIDTFCKELLNKHKDVETELITVLQILYQILRTLQDVEEDVCQMNVEIFDLLTDILFSNHNSTLNAKILTCLHMQIFKFHSKSVIEKIWSNLTSTEHSSVVAPRSAQVLVQLFDEFNRHLNDFHRNEHLVTIVQQLVVSEVREERKSAYFLMKKILEVVIERASHISQWEWDNTATLSNYWTAYITIMENLEENQSHLILPSLEHLKTMEYRQGPWQKWMDILYKHILDHNNILVIRWTLEYFLETFNASQLDTEVLKHLLDASNNTNLYNGEGYFLPKENIAKFLKCQSAHLLELFADISWKPVPLHFWLKQIGLHIPSAAGSTSKELLLKLAARVRVLQNPLIRKGTITLFESTFAKTIDSLQLRDYVSLIQTLYNVMDLYINHEVFIRKLQASVDLNETAVVFPQRFYEIFTNNWNDEVILNPIFECLSNIPKEKHSWMRFYIVFDINIDDKVNSFCRFHYDLDLVNLKNFTLTEITTEFCNKLVWLKAEESFVREKSVEFYLRLNRTFFADMSSSVEELLEIGSVKTLFSLSLLLSMQEKEMKPLNLDSFVRAVKRSYKYGDYFCKQVVGYILQYCKNTQTAEIAEQYAEDILNIDLQNLSICKAVLSSKIRLSKETYLKGILLGDAKTGDARIEEIYEIQQLENKVKLYEIRYLYLTCMHCDYRNSILKEILQLNGELSRKKPRYFENSMDHRLKMRIAYAILYLMHCENVEPLATDDLWHILLRQNNQLNVTYMYELLMAKCATNVQVFLDKLNESSKYTPSQQVSVICVTHSYCILNLATLEASEITEILNLLAPLTMGAHFQTRLYAQLAIYSICSQTSVCIPNAEFFKRSIALVLGDQLTELMADVRLKLPYIYLASPKDRINDTVMYLTNAPYDEYCHTWKLSEFENSRILFTKKINTSTKQTPVLHSKEDVEGSMKSSSNCHVQRKMNPSSDILVKDNFILYPECKENEIYVIASLIDKLPNLGGIARTCEVLGIKNLIMDSKSHAEKSEFKNLSMTAEKGLNILEVKPSALIDFLMQKQSEGFQIVGAEQTANSKSFVDFKFPKKCILLLGHEKSGIPANLLGFLDHAVEIPQFGMVRSLNVHVTGALFMWEYCKQHIVEN